MEVAPGSKATLSDPSSPGPGYIFFRLVNIVTLIACFAVLAQVMTIFSNSNTSTPQSVVYMFAVGIIGTVWSILILITFIRANNVSITIAFFDFVGMILCIVGVALLTKPAIDECAAAKAGVQNEVSRTDDVGSVCGLLRAGWGLALANIIFFFLCFIGGVQIAMMVAEEYRRLGGPVARRTVIEEGYPVQPAVRNVSQTTTAAVPVQPGTVFVEKEKTSNSRRHGSRSGDRHRHSHSSSKRRRSHASVGTRDDYYYPDRRDSRRSSRRDY
ncbi:hypothetical protein TWF730_006821 [Orbilia blumenaviensis]|uniref:MARVEL domain-containing protein n=1 Tax=Orbilia blumenaviensis TaxID=1796055 RepID=A0AAV9VFE2_9PEZI